MTLHTSFKEHFENFCESYPSAIDGMDDELNTLWKDYLFCEHIKGNVSATLNFSNIKPSEYLPDDDIDLYVQVLNISCELRPSPKKDGEVRFQSLLRKDNKTIAAGFYDRNGIEAKEVIFNLLQKIENIPDEDEVCLSSPEAVLEWQELLHLEILVKDMFPVPMLDDLRKAFGELY